MLKNAGGPLNALLEGYLRGSEMRMKEARDKAQDIIDKEERKFRMDQAQNASRRADEQLQYQKDTLAAAEKHRLAQDTLSAQREADKDKLDKAKLELSQHALDIKKEQMQGTWDQKKQIAQYQAFQKKFQDAMAKGLGAESAAELAQFANTMAGNIFGGQQQSGQPEQPQMGGLNQQGGLSNPALQAPQSFIPGHASQGMHQQQAQPNMNQLLMGQHPGIGNQVLPAVQKHMQAEEERIAKTRAQTKLIEDFEAANKKFLEAKTALVQSNKKHVDFLTEHGKEMAPLQMVDLITRTEATKSHMKMEVEGMNIRERADARAAVAARLKSNPTDASARKDMTSRYDKSLSEKERLSKLMMEAVKAGANIDQKIQDAEQHHDRKTADRGRGMKIALGNQLADFKAMYEAANAEYLETMKAMDQYRIRVPTNADGTPDKAAEKAHRGSLRPYIPTAVIPLGAPQLPAGEYARGRTAQSKPPAQTLKKKSVKDRSTEDLWNELKK